VKQSPHDVTAIATGTVVLVGWGGTTRTPVEIIGTTPKRYRIRAVTEMRLGRRHRWLTVGETALVPRRAVCDVKPTRPDGDSDGLAVTP